jgi:hypothetical protein
VFPVRYELGFAIPKDDILHSFRRENLKCDAYFVILGLVEAESRATAVHEGAKIQLP